MTRRRHSLSWFAATACLWGLGGCAIFGGAHCDLTCDEPEPARIMHVSRPVAGETYLGEIPIAVELENPLYPLETTHVVARIDDQVVLDQAATTGPWTVTPPGPSREVAVALYADGTDNDETITVQYLTATLTPAVELCWNAGCQPVLNGDNIYVTPTPGEIVTVRASATGDALGEVVFTVDGAPTADVEAPFEHGIALDPLAAGPHAITVELHDVGDRRTATWPWTLILQP